ncbi:MAG: T9SS type A sorting domain-containing protein [Saprospiraceae bacterium]|nr:T9SS type A sorting domain-containing protein [Saprospiraceae bacterium]
MEYGLYLTFSARDLNYKVNDSLEVVLQFNLPEKAIVTDSWLWIGNDICQAAILDVWTASNIYENIVNRRKDPSLLRKHTSTNYSLRVFPMGGSEKRQVKITYLVPFEWGNSELSVAIPHDIPNASKNIPLDFPILLWENDDFKFIRLDNPNTSPLVSGTDPVLGNYKTTTLAPIGSFKSTNLFYSHPKQEPVYVGHYKNGEENYYQLAIQPGYFINEVKSSKIMYLVDYQEDPVLPKETVLTNLKNELKKTLKATDSFNLIVTHINVQPTFSTWHSATAENIDLAFDLAKSRISNFSNLPAMIASGINFMDEKGNTGNIVLLNNSDQFNNFDAANGLIKEIRILNQSAYKFSILDYGKRIRSSYFNNKLYYDNEYLLLNLATLFGGYYINTKSGKTFINALSEAAGDALPVIKHFDMYFKPSQGISYGKYNLQNTGVNTSVNAYIRQTGIFKGSFPLTIELNGEISNELFFHTLTIDENSVIQMDSSAKTQWQAQGIQSLESSSSGNANSIDIIRKSIDARVLSLYTAFLCVEDTSLYCSNCIDENNVPTANDDFNRDSLWDLKVYPNPFADHLNIEIHFKNQVPDNNKIQGKIMDLSGRLLRKFETQLNKNNYLSYRWDGLNSNGMLMPNGVYVVVLEMERGSLHKKVMKF